MPQSIAIIGAGIAGLAAGCYAQMNGYDSEIFELHDLPGGLCTAWERRDYCLTAVSTTSSAPHPTNPIIGCGRSWGRCNDARYSTMRSCSAYVIPRAGD